MSWEQDLLQKLGAPASPVNVQKLDLWERAEGGLEPEHANNPFNTSLDSAFYPHVPTTNIPIYPSLGFGVNETARTLLHSNPQYGYGPIVANLRSSGPVAQFAQALQRSSWAGGHYAGNTAISQAAGGVLPNPSQGTSPFGTPGTAPTIDTGATSQVVSQGSGIIAGSLEEFVTRLLQLVLGVALLWIGAKGLIGVLAPRAAGLFA